MRWKETVAAAGVLLLMTACGQGDQASDEGGTAPVGEKGSATEDLTKLPNSSSPSSDSGDSGEAGDGQQADEGIPGAEPQEGSAGAPEGKPVPDKRIDADALPKGYPVKASADGTELVVIGKEGGCTKASAELLKQGERRVVVRMVETNPVSKHQMCTMDLRHPPLTVELDQPLGTRTVELHYVERKT